MAEAGGGLAELLRVSLMVGGCKIGEHPKKRASSAFTPLRRALSAEAVPPVLALLRAASGVSTVLGDPARLPGSFRLPEYAAELLPLLLRVLQGLHSGMRVGLRAGGSGWCVSPAALFPPDGAAAAAARPATGAVSGRPGRAARGGVVIPSASPASSWIDAV